MKLWLCRIGWHDWHRYRTNVFQQDKATIETQLTCFIGMLVSSFVAALCYETTLFSFVTPLAIAVALATLGILVITTCVTGIFGESKTLWDGVCLRCERVHLGLSHYELKCKNREQRATQHAEQQAEEQELRMMRAQQLRSTFEVQRLEKLEQETL